MAFLLNQMNAGAFKINTLEKPEVKANNGFQRNENKVDFSKELRAVVDEKRQAEKVSGSNTKNFENKLSKFNHDSKQKVKEYNLEKQIAKKNENEQLTQKTENNQPEEKVEPAQLEEVKVVSEKNPISEENKTDETKGKSSESAGEAKKVDGTESATDVVAKEELNTNLAKMVEQLISIMKSLKDVVSAENAPTESELTKATDLLDKINTGKIDAKDAFKEIKNLISTIGNLTNGKSSTEAKSTEFQKLMEITGDQLKVIKNEIADAKSNMNSSIMRSVKAEDAKANAGANGSGNAATVIKPETAELGKSAEVRQNAEVKPKTEGIIAEVPNGTEELAAAQGKKATQTVSDKQVKADLSEEAVDAKTQIKVESLKANNQDKNMNSGNDTQSKGTEIKGIEGSVKAEKSADNINFQTVTQNLVKESEKPVEVGKTARTPVLDKAEVLSQIVKKAELLVGKTNSEMIMKLEPENLGKVTLKIAVERGNVTATFQAENQQVKALIESNSNSLRDMLQEKGINITAINVSVNQQSGENPNWKNQNQGQNFNQGLGKSQGITNRSNSMNNGYGTFGVADFASSKNNPYTRHDGDLDLRG